MIKTINCAQKEKKKKKVGLIVLFIGTLSAKQIGCDEVAVLIVVKKTGGSCAGLWNK